MMSLANPPRGISVGGVDSVNTAGSRNDAPYAAVEDRTTSLRSPGYAWQAASSCMVPMML